MVKFLCRSVDGKHLVRFQSEMYLFKSLFDLAPFPNLSVFFSGSLETSTTGDGAFLRLKRKRKRSHRVVRSG